jgi:hypothetical protein
MLGTRQWTRCVETSSRQLRCYWSISEGLEPDENHPVGSTQQSAEQALESAPRKRYAKRSEALEETLPTAAGPELSARHFLESAQKRSEKC